MDNNTIRKNIGILKHIYQLATQSKGAGQIFADIRALLPQVINDLEQMLTSLHKEEVK